MITCRCEHFPSQRRLARPLVSLALPFRATHSAASRPGRQPALGCRRLSERRDRCCSGHRRRHLLTRSRCPGAPQPTWVIR